MKRINIRHWLIKKLGGYTGKDLVMERYDHIEPVYLDSKKNEIITLKAMATSKDTIKKDVICDLLLRDLMYQAKEDGLMTYLTEYDPIKMKYIYKAYIQILKPITLYAAENNHRRKNISHII